MEGERRVTRGRNKKPEPTVILTRIDKNLKASSNSDVGNIPAALEDKELAKNSMESSQISQPQELVIHDVNSSSTSKAPNSKFIAEHVKPLEEIKVKQTNFPITLTTNTSSQAPYKITSTSSVHSSSYSTTTQETVEISDNPATSSDIHKLSDYLRRSMSKTFSNKREGIELREGSAITTHDTIDGSRSRSRSVYDHDDDESFCRGDSNSVTNCPQKRYKDDFGSAIFCRQQKTPREFGGEYGIIVLLILCPCAVYYLQWCCSGLKCELKYFTLPTITKLNYAIKEMFLIEALPTYFVAHIGIFLLGSILPGYSVRLPGCPRYRFIALPVSIVALLAFALAEYLKYPVVDFYLRNFDRFIFFAVINAYGMGIRLFLKPNMLADNANAHWNPYAKTGNFIIDYALGRQINPKWMRTVEFKSGYYCTSLLMTFLYAACLLYKDLQVTVFPSDNQDLGAIYDLYNKLNYNPAVVLTSSMLLIYVLDAILFEHNLAASFEMQHEGCGTLLLLRYSLTPYLLSSVAKYFYDFRYSSPIGSIILALSWGLLCLGLFLKRYSNIMKYKYRLNPYQAKFANFETIHTFQGHRLLASSLWGWIRQPNYFGDILSLLALCVPLALKFALVPAFNISLLILLLIHRCRRVNKRNMDRYHSSWIRYCQTVPYYLIPHVY